MKDQFTISRYWYWSIFALFTLIYIKGLFNFVYGIDAKIYASISREMLETGNWLEIYKKGYDYLDKPPLLFWLSAASYKIFGISSFAYKLPSFIFTLIGVYSTFKLGKLLYSETIGKLASLLYYTCFVIVLINQDVRTDTILTGIVVFALWQLISFIKNNKKINLTLGFIGIGLAMLAKGPLGIMIPVLAIGTELIVKKDWVNIFRWEWLLGLVIAFIVISPMLYGLYTQFDAQPNKVFLLSSGKEVKGYSGLKFYLWDQSFGRVLGGNAEGWKNDAGPFFFVHTFLWSFIPWTFLGIIALFIKLRTNIKNISTNEWYSIGAIILPFIAFSLSSYKLPHYIISIFPYLFILTAFYITSNSNTLLSRLNQIAQLSISVLLAIAPFIVLTYIFPTLNFIIWAIVIAFIFAIIIVWIKKRSHKRYLITSALSMGLCVFIFNYHFVPSMKNYEATYQASKKINESSINTVYLTTINGFSLDLFIKKRTELLDYSKLKELTNKNNAIFIEANHLGGIKSNIDVKKVIYFKHKELSKLTPMFINPKTRAKHLDSFCLVFF